MCEVIEMLGIDASFPLLDNEWYDAIGGVEPHFEFVSHWELMKGMQYHGASDDIQK